MKAKKIILLTAVLIISGEVLYAILHSEFLLDLGKKYFWMAPLVFFKTSLKKFLILNLYGILKVFSSLLLHLLKLIFIKILKTVGIRYVTFFSQSKWHKTTQRLRIIIKKGNRLRRKVVLILSSFTRWQLTLVIIAFLPLVVFLLLFGFTFKLTREAMVKKGSEIGATKAALSTASKSRGLVARIRQLDQYILQKIKNLTIKQQY